MGDKAIQWRGQFYVGYGYSVGVAFGEVRGEIIFLLVHCINTPTGIQISANYKIVDIF